MDVDADITIADEDAIKADLDLMTARWDELPEPAIFEIRAFKAGTQPKIARFAPDFIPDAVDWITSLNSMGYNIYCVRNPILHTTAGSASDTDIIGSFYLWADCDDIEAAKNVFNFVGPKWTAAVTTGTTPSKRVHVYWELQDLCTDMDAWRAMQVTIANRFRSDRTVVNPSRIMRVAGTVTYPDEKKQARGYVKEVATLSREYEPPRAPITFEQMHRAFEKMGGPNETPPLTIDTGMKPTLDREAARVRALSGHEWHHAVVRLTGSYVAKGLSDEEIHALTDQLTLPGYTVEQTRAEVQQAIDGARAKGWTPEPTPQPEFQKPDDEAAPDFPSAFTDFDAAAIQPRQWIYAHHYLRRFVSVLASAGGIGKTSLQVVEALAICTGRPLLGEEVKSPCNVWIVNLEDPFDEMQRRILAAMQHYNIAPDEVRGKLFLDAGRDFQMVFAQETRDGVIPNEALIDHLNAKIPERNIGCVFIDPFVGAHQVNENNNVSVNFVTDKIRKIADETNCAIGLVHHTRKGNGIDADIDSVRGAGSLIGAARAARVINRMSKEAAQAAGVPLAEAKAVFRVDDGKNNLTPPAESATYRKMVGVQIANGEWVGVAEAYELPDEWAGMTPDVVNNILDMIDAGTTPGEESYYSARPQDKTRWVGKVILNYPFLNADNQKSELQAKLIIKKWLETGLLEEIEFRCNAARKDRKGVISTGRSGVQK